MIKSSINSNPSNNKSFYTSAIAQDLFSNPVLIEVQAECREKISWNRKHTYSLLWWTNPMLLFKAALHLCKDLWRSGRNTPKNCIFQKYIVGGLLLHPRAGWGLIFGPWASIIPKSSYQDLSTEGSKMFWVHWNLFFKLLKHGHFWINFRFWLVWVELTKRHLGHS